MENTGKHNYFIINYFEPYINLKKSTKQLYINCITQLHNLSKNNINTINFLRDYNNIINIILLNYTNINTIKLYFSAILFVYKNDPLFDESIYENTIIKKNEFLKNAQQIETSKVDAIGGSTWGHPYNDCPLITTTLEVYNKDNIKQKLQKKLKHFIKYGEEDFDQIDKKYVDELCEYVILHFYIHLKPLTKYDLFDFIIQTGNIPAKYHNVNFVYYSPMNQFMQLYYNNYKSVSKNGSIVQELDNTTYRLVRHYMKVYNYFYKIDVKYLFTKNNKKINNPQAYLKALLTKYFPNENIKICDLL